MNKEINMDRFPAAIIGEYMESKFWGNDINIKEVFDCDKLPKNKINNIGILTDVNEDNIEEFTKDKFFKKYIYKNITKYIIKEKKELIKEYKKVKKKGIPKKFEYDYIEEINDLNNIVIGLNNGDKEILLKKIDIYLSYYREYPLEKYMHLLHIYYLYLHGFDFDDIVGIQYGDLKRGIEFYRLLATDAKRYMKYITKECFDEILKMLKDTEDRDVILESRKLRITKDNIFHKSIWFKMFLIVTIDSYKYKYRIGEYKDVQRRQ